MIVTENFTIGGKQFIRTYSSNGMKVHGGTPASDYDVAEDPAELGRTYTETDIPIDDSTAEEIIEILTGGAEE